MNKKFVSARCRNPARWKRALPGISPLRTAAATEIRKIELNFVFVYLGRSHLDPIPRMQRLFRIFIGPELYWVLLYLGVRWLAAHNVPPTAAGNNTLEWAVWLTATAGVALSFVFLAVPGVNRSILLTRLAVAAFIGVNVCAIAACEAIKYPELGRDSGLMALWFIAAMLGGVIWCIAAGVSLLILRVKSLRSPVVRP